MTKNTKAYLLTVLLWIINIKIFLILANWDQLSLIWKYSPSIMDFWSQAFQFYFQFVTTIPLLTLLLSVLFAVLLAFFWYYYFQVYFHKLPNKKSPDETWVGLLGNIFTFLGFGCVACGQTLLTSVLLLFVSGTSAYLAEFAGNFSIIVGILFLSFGIYKNHKIYHDKNICQI